MLLPFCELAFTDLISEGRKLVIQKGYLERQLGQSQVDLAYRVGLISQAKVRSNLNSPQNVSVSFYHKSVQELLAAMYMTCGDRDAVTSFYGYCSTLEKVMETANVTMFVMGLDPSLGCRICEHITNIIEYRRTFDNDPDITEYRRTLGDDHHDRVLQLYRTQCEWYRELTHVRTVTGDTSPPPSLHVTDIYLYGSDSDTVRLTGDLMSANLGRIVSVSLWDVRPPLHGVAQLLPQCPNLTALCIYMRNTENRDLLVAVIPRLTQLTTVRYHGRYPSDAAVNYGDFLVPVIPGLKQVIIVPCVRYQGGHWSDAAANRPVVAAVMSLTQLVCIRLEQVSLGDDGLEVTDAMTRLTTVVLHVVRMTVAGWDRFVSSLLIPPPVSECQIRGDRH